MSIRVLLAIAALIAGIGSSAHAQDMQKLMGRMQFGEQIGADELRAAIEAGADIDAEYTGGWTPLALAADSQRDPEILRILISAGADPGKPSSTGTTPLGWAINESGMGETRQPPEIVQVLLEGGADPDAPARDDGKTALALAVHYGRSDLLPLLIGAGANLEARDKYGDTPLHMAVRSTAASSLEIVRTLIEAGADIEALTEGDIFPGRSVLMAASCSVNANPAIVRDLLSAGADPMALGKGLAEETALFHALTGCSGGTPEIVLILLEAELAANEDWLNDTRETTRALVDAAKYSDNPDIVRALIEAGGDPEAAMKAAADNPAMQGFDWPQ